MIINTSRRIVPVSDLPAPKAREKKIECFPQFSYVLVDFFKMFLLNSPEIYFTPAAFGGQKSSPILSYPILTAFIPLFSVTFKKTRDKKPRDFFFTAENPGINPGDPGVSSGKGHTECSSR